VQKTFPLTFYLFGSPRIERDGAALHLPRRKSLALLVYLFIALLFPERLG